MYNKEKIFGYTIEQILQICLQYGMRLLAAILLLVIGFWIAGVLSRSMKRVLTKRKIDAGLIGFLSSMTSVIIKILVIITAITQLGIQMTSFVAILASAGLTIGMAFSGTLSNFAGGVMLLLNKPFRVGDVVVLQSHEGTVKEITIFNTILMTAENKTVILPNGPVSNGNIINYSVGETRRIEWKIPMDKADDYSQIKNIVSEIIENEPLILKTPAYFVGLGDLSSPTPLAVVHAWVKNGNQGKLFYKLNESFYNEITAQGFELPKNEMNITIKK